LGKDHAIGFARSLVDPETDETIRTFPGRLTQALLSDQLVANQNRQDLAEGDTGAATWLVQSELFADLPGGELTKALVADLVRLYQGSGSSVVLNATRMHGTRRVDRGPVINWLAGSTAEWFAKSITPDVFDSGFAGRSVFVGGERDYEQRYAEPRYPDDHLECVDHLVERVRTLAEVSGCFGCDDRAASIEREWVENRPAPTSDLEAKVWDRQHVLSLKLAMLLAIAERTEPLVIEPRHMSAAQALVAQVQAGMALVAQQVHETRERGLWRKIRNRLKGRRLHKSMLVDDAAALGLGPGELESMLWLMVRAGEVETVKTEHGGLLYQLKR